MWMKTLFVKLSRTVEPSPKFVLLPTGKLVISRVLDTLNLKKLKLLMLLSS